jgi:hypothetical protein
MSLSVGAGGEQGAEGAEREAGEDAMQMIHGRVSERAGGVVSERIGS